jgi:ring-1,2-phenylacetyl-CoA epoxidase subunit PaaE
VAVEFHPLAVSVRPETADSVVVTLGVPDALRETFRHVPGQHVVLRAWLDGEDVRRSYSICTSPDDGALRVGIKRIAGGAFSTYATSELADGDVLEVMPPIGEFCHRPNPGASGHYVALAAGSGITPVLSILTSILEVERSSHCTLVYGNRYARSIMFLEELEALKDRFCDRFQLIHVLSREPHEIPLFEGRIDGDKLRLLAKTLIPVEAVDAWFCCGPLDMVETARATLGELGVDDSRIRYELFFDQRIEPVPDAPASGEGLASLTVTIDGRTSVVPVDPGGPSLLDYARTVRPEVPFACKGGMCATCKARVIEGEVTMAKNYALTEAEVADGFILSCQSHPAGGGDVAITYDVHGGLGR